MRAKASLSFDRTIRYSSTPPNANLSRRTPRPPPTVDKILLLKLSHSPACPSALRRGNLGNVIFISREAPGSLLDWCQPIQFSNEKNKPNQRIESMPQNSGLSDTYWQAPGLRITERAPELELTPSSTVSGSTQSTGPAGKWAAEYTCCRHGLLCLERGVGDSKNDQPARQAWVYISKSACYLPAAHCELICLL